MPNRMRGGRNNVVLYPLLFCTINSIHSGHLIPPPGIFDIFHVLCSSHCEIYFPTVSNRCRKETMSDSRTPFYFFLSVVVVLVFATPANAFGAGNIASIAKIEGYNFRHGDIEVLILRWLKAKYVLLVHSHWVFRKTLSICGIGHSQKNRISRRRKMVFKTNSSSLFWKLAERLFASSGRWNPKERQ
jgi:hypothetical protein